MTAGAAEHAGILDAEQALRPHQQHHRHHQIDQEQREAREIGLAEGIDLADQQAADEGAAQASHPADDDDDEGGDENFGIHAGIEPEHGASRDAAERGQRHAGAEDAGEEERDIGAEPRRHGGVVDAGAHHGADAAAVEEQPQQQRHRKAEPDQEQAVGREHAEPDLGGALEDLRRRQPHDHAAPYRLHQIEEHEGEAEGQQHLVHVAAAIERPHEHELHHDSDRGDRNGREQKREPEAAGELVDRKPEERAQHEERAVREAHDVHQAEDEGEAGCHQEQQHPIDQPVQELGDDELHAPSARHHAWGHSLLSDAPWRRAFGAFPSPLWGGVTA